MRLAPLAAALAAAAFFTCSGSARAAGPSLLIGTTDDAVKSSNLVAAKSKMSILKLAGFDSLRITSIWFPGETKPDGKEVVELRTTISAARLNGIRLFLSVYNNGNRTTPLTDEDQANFAEYAAWLARTFPYVRDFVIGNEPNLNRFWLPQFNEDGSDAAAPAYLQLLAKTYDALKQVSRQIAVIGGTLAPRGIDRPGTARDTHSPSQFIRDMGEAFWASGRQTPVMDQIAMHPYGDSSSQPPKKSHHPNTTIGLADYAKLVRILGESFDGSAQRGSTLPIVYEEFGVESQIPKKKLSRYTGTEPASTRPVNEATQAAYYKQAIQLAFCQTNVRALMLFHVFDESARLGWQSGLYYADQRPKTSLVAVRRSIGESRRGVVDHCRDLRLTPRVLALVWPRGRITGKKPVRIRLTCSIDCAYTARIERLPKGQPVATARGRAVGKVATLITLKPRKAKNGRYRLRLSLVAPVNPGPPLTLTSPALTLG